LTSFFFQYPTPKAVPKKPPVSPPKINSPKIPQKINGEPSRLPKRARKSTFQDPVWLTADVKSKYVFCVDFGNFAILIRYKFQRWTCSLRDSLHQSGRTGAKFAVQFLCLSVPPCLRWTHAPRLEYSSWLCLHSMFIIFKKKLNILWKAIRVSVYTVEFSVALRDCSLKFLGSCQPAKTKGYLFAMFSRIAGHRSLPLPQKLQP
jgi:hypothetical protein